MRSNNSQEASGLTTRQKIMMGVFVMVVLFIGWQVYGLFSGNGAAPAPRRTNSAARNGVAQAPVQTPQTAQLPPAQPAVQPTTANSAAEAQISKMQQETQNRYINSVTELQMLKIARDIAETNRAIAAAKLATVTAEKGIVNLLSPPEVEAPNYAKGLVAPKSSSTTTVTAKPGQPVQEEIVDTSPKYTVVSVTQLDYRWSAVIGSKGVLYNVHIGDVLPPDGSKVITIDRSGVTLEKDNLRTKVSLVPVI